MADDGPARPAADAGALTGTTGRALLFAGNLAEPGGGRVVGAWAAQALLAMGYKVELVTWASPKLAALDLDCGTQLADDDRLAVRAAPSWLQRGLAACRCRWRCCASCCLRAGRARSSRATSPTSSSRPPTRPTSAVRCSSTFTTRGATGHGPTPSCAGSMPRPPCGSIAPPPTRSAASALGAWRPT